MMIAVAGPAQSLAARIALKIEPSSRFKAGTVTVTVKLTNLGDESVNSVWTEAVVGRSSARGMPVESLATNATTVAAIEVTDAPTTPGIYTIIMKVHYQDVRGHPFTALKSIPLITAVRGAAEESPVAHLSNLHLGTEGEVVLDVSAPTNAAIKGTARLVLPDDLACPDPVSDIELAAGDSASVTFPVHRHFARPGSRYLVLAVIDYTLEGEHRSIVAQGSVSTQLPAQPFSGRNTKAWLIAGAILLAAFGVAQFTPRAVWDHRFLARLESLFVIITLLCVAAFLFYHIPPRLLISDTVTVGGDTPAHNYMASHLKTQLLEHGRVVSWSNGWWCGFPMFQYYFCLPYLLMAMLSFLMPLTIALKIVSVTGILLLPFAAWLAARIMRLPRPTPSFLAIATLPVLFDPSNTMWGVNIYSTLAGMIANSISFPLMILFLASASRDVDDRRFRLRTVLLLAAVAASHFFTLIIACLTAAVIPLLHGRHKILPGIWIVACECALGLLLMSWWLVPLMAKHQYSVDFGVNWPDAQLPAIIGDRLPLTAVPLIAILPALIGLVLAIVWASPFMGMVAHMLLVSSLLFLFGYESVSHVFQNIRFWPFISYSIMALAAFLIAVPCRRARARTLAVALVLLLVFLYGTDQPNHVRNWARWNYEGLQKKARWPVFGELLIPKLKDTPGRLANDLHPDNASIGSSRIFECVPFLTGKPVLEGGIVNSAAGSIFSYYIQGETSRDTAGFPNIVQPTTFDFTNATRHLALFNVKHFVARWTGTKEALARSPDWRLLGECQGWELHELTTHDGGYVFVPRNDPVPVRIEPHVIPGREWKEAGLEWMYNIASIDQHYVLLQTDHEPPPGTAAISRDEFMARVRPPRGEEKPPPPPPLRDGIATNVVITDEVVLDNSISFRTSAPGRPHIIKCTWFPNWQVRGAERVYMVTPCFMLVYPDAEEVELYYGYTLSDNVGRALSGLAVLLAGLVAVVQLIRRRKT